MLRLDVPIRPLWCHRLSVHIQRCGHGRAREKVTRMGTTRPLHHHPFLSSGNEVLRGMEAGQMTLGRAGARASLHWPDGPAWLDPSSISATLVDRLIDG